MERMTRKARLRYWVEALRRCARECAERGITKQQWIAERGVSAKTFYNWQSKAALPASETPVLTELPVAKSMSKEEGSLEARAFKPAAILRVGRMEAALSDAALPELIRKTQKGGVVEEGGARSGIRQNPPPFRFYIEAQAVFKGAPGGTGGIFHERDNPYGAFLPQ